MRLIHLVVLSLTVSFLAAASVFAVPTKTPQIDPTVAPFVAQLHQVVQVLNGANHDYDGHRAAAVHEVHKAIHALHPHHKVVQPGTVTVKPAVQRRASRNRPSKKIKENRTPS